MNKLKSILRNVVAIAICLTATTTTFTSCGALAVLAEMSAEQGVVINGVRWSTRNVAAPGRLTTTPQEYGGYFTWEEARNICPTGWRLPTQAEWTSLHRAGATWTTRQGIEGVLFGTAPHQIFLPAAGNHQPHGGGFIGRDIWGRYWSSTAAAGVGHRHILSFDNGLNGIATAGFENNTAGLSVRCVADVD